MDTILSKLGFLGSVWLKSWTCQLQLQMPLKIWAALLKQSLVKLDSCRLWQ